MTIKASDVRKILKSATVETWIVPGYGSVYTASVAIIAAPRYEGDDNNLYLRIEAQANDLYHPDNREGSFAHQRQQPGYWHLEGLGPFYAVHIEARYNVVGFGSGSDYENPERIEAFLGVLHKVIEDRNLRHVYNECGVSQVLKALEYLGATIREPKMRRHSAANPMERYEWNEQRRESRPQAPEQPQ